MLKTKLTIQTIFLIIIICILNASAEPKQAKELLQKFELDSNKTQEYYRSMREHKIIRDPKARVGNFISFKGDDFRMHVLQMDSSRMHRKGLLKKLPDFAEPLKDSVLTLNFFNKDTVKIVIDTTYKTEIGISIWAHTLGCDYINVTFSISQDGYISGHIIPYKNGKTLLIHTVEKGVLIGIEQDATDTTVNED